MGPRTQKDAGLVPVSIIASFPEFSYHSIPQWGNDISLVFIFGFDNVLSNVQYKAKPKPRLKYYQLDTK